MILPQVVDRNAQLIATAAEDVKYVEEYVDDVEVVWIDIVRKLAGPRAS